MSKLSQFAAFGGLPSWISRSLAFLWTIHQEQIPKGDVELRFELGINNLQLNTLRHDLRLVDERSPRPTALGLLQLPESESVIPLLERLVGLAHDRYRPNAGPIATDELLELLGLDAERAERIFPYGADLDIGLRPGPWRLELSEHGARHATLESALHERYLGLYERHAAPIALPSRSIDLRLRRLRAVGFRSLRSFDLPLPSNLTVLVGPNRVGKSTVLEALQLVAQIVTVGLHTAIEAKGGMERLHTKGSHASIALELGFEARFGEQRRLGRYEFTIRGFGTGLVSDREVLELSGEHGTQLLIDGQRCLALAKQQDGTTAEVFHTANELALPMLRPATTYPAQTELRAALASLFVLDHGQPESLHKLWSQLAVDDEALHKVNEIIDTLVPGIERLIVVYSASSSAGSVDARLEAKERGVAETIPLQDLSAGTRQLLVLAALYASPSPPQVLLLEEPEAAIHPGALPAFRDLLRSLAERSTVIATSHSPAFVSLLDPDREVVALEREGDDVRARPLAEAIHSRRWLEAFGTPGEAFFRAASERSR